MEVEFGVDKEDDAMDDGVGIIIFLDRGSFTHRDIKPAVS